MPDERDCVVKLVDMLGVEHGVKVRAASVFEAALKGLKRLQQVGWEGDGSTIGTVTVEIWEEPTRHQVDVPKMLQWIQDDGRYPLDLTRKEKLRRLL